MLLSALLVAACTATTGQRTVFPDATGTSSKMHRSTDDWFVVIAFTISKPGRYYLGKVRVDYTAGGGARAGST